jgi:hypothetical protein
MLETYLCACLVGIATETTARMGRLWIYRRVIYPVTNILVMFGLVMGGLSLTIPALGYFPVLLLVAAIGYGYELLNFAVLEWWDFPRDRFLVFRGRQACALSVGALWGLVPLLTYYLRQLVF